MKVQQLRDVLKEAARQKEQADDADASRILRDFAQLIAPHDSKTVGKLAKLIKTSFQ